MMLKLMLAWLLRPGRHARCLLAACCLLAPAAYGKGVDISMLDSMVLRSPASFHVSAQPLEPDQLPLDQFRPLTDGDANRGITGAYHWVRVRLSNTEGDAPVAWVLHHETSYVDEMLVLYADNGGAWRRTLLSDRHPFHDRPLNYRTLALSHATPAGGYTDLLLRLHFQKPDSLTLNLFLTRDTVFQARSRAEYLVFGVYYGLMATLLLIALIFAVIMRQAVYFHYALFLTASMLMWALLNGFAYQYVWPGSVFWHNEGFHIVYLLMAMAAVQFSRRFLKTSRHFPRLDRGMVLAQWLMAGGIAVRFMGVYLPVLVLSFVALSLLSLLAVLGFMAYRRGVRYARWYAAAWAIYGVGLVFSVLSAGSSLFDWGMSPLLYAQAGGVLEAVCLLVALGERLIGWDRDRKVALRIAHQDPLTGLGNRRALSEAFDRIEEQLPHQRQSLYLILIDLDHFKAVNDRYGHEAGDLVLRQLAQLFERVCRPEDVCVRFGGEEFAILLASPSQRHAMDVAERLRLEFSREPTVYEGVALEHTLSAGLTCVGSPGREICREEAVRQADLALYEAKRRGRDRVVAYAEIAREQGAMD